MPVAHHRDGKIAADEAARTRDQDAHDKSLSDPGIRLRSASRRRRGGAANTSIAH
jgi:hypothetical protein